MLDLTTAACVGCCIGERMIILDLVASRYRLADQRDVCEGRAPPPPGDRCAILAWSGSTSCTRATAREHWVRRPRATAPQTAGHAGIGALGRLAWDERPATRQLKPGIAAGIAWLLRMPRGDGAPGRQAACVAAACRSQRLWSARDRCLPRSLALARQLRSCGSSASLVIGVSLDPFCAHAWVQEEDMVLNDAIDNVSLFTPILVA